MSWIQQNSKTGAMAVSQIEWLGDRSDDGLLIKHLFDTTNPNLLGMALIIPRSCPYQNVRFDQILYSIHVG
jgi:hypothetical protein